MEYFHAHDVVGEFEMFVFGWSDVGEIASRIVHYISGANQVVQLLVSEAILTSKDRKYVLYLCYVLPIGT